MFCNPAGESLIRHTAPLDGQHADKGNTVMFSTHVLEIAEKVCDRIMIIDSGKIIYTGTMESLRSGGEGADLEKIFLKMTSEA